MKEQQQKIYAHNYLYYRSETFDSKHHVYMNYSIVHAEGNPWLSLCSNEDTMEDEHRISLTDQRLKGAMQCNQFRNQL